MEPIFLFEFSVILSLLCLFCYYAEVVLKYCDFSFVSISYSSFLIIGVAPDKDTDFTQQLHILFTVLIVDVVDMTGFWHHNTNLKTFFVNQALGLRRCNYSTVF